MCIQCNDAAASFRDLEFWGSTFSQSVGGAYVLMLCLAFSCYKPSSLTPLDSHRGSDFWYCEYSTKCIEMGTPVNDFCGKFQFL